MKDTIIEEFGTQFIYVFTNNFDINLGKIIKNLYPIQDHMNNLIVDILEL